MNYLLRDQLFFFKVNLFFKKIINFWGKDIMLSKRCQISIVKHLNYGGGSHKKYIHTMRFTHTNVNFDIKYEGDQNWSKMLSVDILRVFGDGHM